MWIVLNVGVNNVFVYILCIGMWLVGWWNCKFACLEFYR